MGWFKSGIDDRIKALVSEAVSAYVERARLSYQFLAIEPKVSDAEMAVLWVAIVDSLANSHQEDATTDLHALLSSTASEFFLTLCQDYIKNVCGSLLTLEPDSPIILRLIHPTMEAMSRERVHVLGNIVGAMSVNAARLAAATVNLLSIGMDKSQAKAASQYGHSLIHNDSTINSFERQKANEWIAAVSWERLPS